MIAEAILITPPKFDAIAVFGIGGLAVLMAIVWVGLFSLGNGRRALILSIMMGVVMTVSAFAASSGKLTQFDSFPPPMLIMMASVVAMALAFGFSPFGRRGALNLSFAILIGFQAFRFPLELVMHHAGTVGIMPVELSFSGYNFDVITGIGALVIFFILQSGRSLPRFVLWLWNIWGSVCLVMIAFIAITASPMIKLFGDDPAHLNIWVLYFPYVWLPVVLVTIAISGHVVLWRKLLAKGLS
jgi:hypothetical protein